MDEVKELQKKIANLEKKIYKLTKEKKVLYESFQKYKGLAEKDPMTDLYNKEIFKYLVENFVTDNDCFLVITDIDNFKNINDTYGHLIADEILKEFSEILKESFRYDDIVARFGGDEFMIFIKNTNLTNVGKLINRFKRNIKKHDNITYTISAGVCKYNFNKLYEENLNNADKALYQSKKNGKNLTNVNV